MGLTVDKITTFLTYWLSVVLAYFGTQTPERLALYVGGSCAIFTALVNFWYRRGLSLNTSVSPETPAMVASL